MHRYTSLLLLFIGLAWGQDCTADDGTEGIELWGNCYSIEHTTELNLEGNQLTGTIPPEIGNLTNLNWLELSSNQLTGEIPPGIGNLTNLTRLSLGYNQLTGEIPSELDNLSHLDWLFLNNNGLTGTIPPEIGDLTNLEVLSLSSNQLIGTIPPEIGNLTNIFELGLNDNQLMGVIPESICNLNIDWYYSSFSNNQFCSPYPSCIEDYVGEQDTTNCGQVSIIDETLPITYNLHIAYPNPFNPVTTLRYDLPEDGLVNITIYDILGKQVRTLVNTSQKAGYKSVRWNGTNSQGRNVSAGMYFYHLRTKGYSRVRKMVLLK